MNTTHVKGLANAITQLGIMAEDKMKDATSSEEYAFLFGNLNLAAALSTAIARNNGEIHISLEYEKALNSYKQAQKHLKTHKDTEEEYHQISMEEFFPKLFKALKTVFEEETQNTQKPSTTKKSTKKE